MLFKVKNNHHQNDSKERVQQEIMEANICMYSIPCFNMLQINAYSTEKGGNVSIFSPRHVMVISIPCHFYAKFWT